MKNHIEHYLSDFKDHINGWPVIQYFLQRNHVTQSALAAHLQISPSAVSQLKQGLFLLNAVQLRSIVRFLEMDEQGVAAFYSQVFRSRLLADDHQPDAQFHLSISSLPGKPEAAVCPLEYLENYEPVIAALGSYLAEYGAADTGSVLIHWPESRPPAGFSGAGSVQLRYQDYPLPGDVVLLKCRSLPCRITRFRAWTETGGLFADLPVSSPEKHILFAGIMWVHPVESPLLNASVPPVPAGP
jgi:hypothetical protein